MILLISGPLAVGKSQVSSYLIEEYGFRKISSSAYLKSVLVEEKIGVSRQSLQELGDRLDIETKYKWLVTDVICPMVQSDFHSYWLIDAVRKPEQVELIRLEFENVFHVHFIAEESILIQRYSQRMATGDHAEGNTTYQSAIIHPNEVSARSLKNVANHVIDLGKDSAEAAAEEIWGIIAPGV